MKLQALALAALCSFSSLFAQHATVTISDRTECDDRVSPLTILESDGSVKLICFNLKKPETWQVTTVTKDNKKTEKTINVGPWSKEDKGSNGSLRTKNHHYFFFSEMARKKDCTVSYISLDKDFGTKDVTLQKLITVPSIMGSGEYLSNAPQGAEWYFETSPDSTKILGKCELLNTERNPFAGVSIFVWNENLQLAWKKDYVLPRKRVKLEKVSYYLSNDGNDAYMLYKYWDDYNHPDNKPGYHYELAKFSKGVSEPVVASLELKDLFLSDVSAVMDPSGTLVVGAIVQQSYTDNFSPGFAMLKMSSSGKMEAYREGIYTLSENELKHLMALKEERKATKVDPYGKYELREASLRLIGFKFGADGTLESVVAPEYCSVSAASNGSKSFADNIYVFCIKPSGPIDHVVTIPRLSRHWEPVWATGPDGSEYFYVWENPANLKRDLTKEAPVYIDEKKTENNTYNLIRLKPDGSIKRIKLFSDEIVVRDKGKYSYSLQNLRFVSDNECMGLLREYSTKGQSSFVNYSSYFRAKLDW